MLERNKTNLKELIIKMKREKKEKEKRKIEDKNKNVSQGRKDV